MTNLEELYTAIDLLRKQGLEPDANLMAKVAEREEELIMKEILPVVKEKIEPTLKHIKRKVTLLVDYESDTPVRVRLSRDKSVVKEEVYLPDAIVEYHPTYQSFCMPPSVRVKYSFATGNISCEKWVNMSPCESVTLSKDDEDRLKTFLSDTRNLRYFLDHVKDPGERMAGAHFACNTVSLKWGKEEKTVNMGDPNNKLGMLMGSISRNYDSY